MTFLGLPLVQVLAAALMTINVVVFALSIVSVFRKHEDTGAMLLALKAGALLSAVSEVWAIIASREVGGFLAWLGVVMLGSSLALFFWAASASKRQLTLAYSGDIPVMVLETGPYRWVRHPFYVSYLMTYSAGVMVSRNLLLLVVVAVMGAIYVHAARTEEAKFAQSPLADAYASYRQRVGMFLPLVTLHRRR